MRMFEIVSCVSLQNSEYESAKIIMSRSQIMTHNTVDVTDTRDTAWILLKCYQNETKKGWNLINFSPAKKGIKK